MVEAATQSGSDSPAKAVAKGSSCAGWLGFGPSVETPGVQFCPSQARMPIKGPPSSPPDRTPGPRTWSR